MSRKEREKKEIWKRFPAGVCKLCAWCMTVAVSLGGLLCGCSVEETGGAKISDLAYVIAEESDVPEELAAKIDEKRTSDFKLTYETDGVLYIVRGYGEQATGGYSIRIKDCYLTANAILFDTELVGPRKGESISASPSYPYIVIKTENREESIIFE